MDRTYGVELKLPGALPTLVTSFKARQAAIEWIEGTKANWKIAISSVDHVRPQEAPRAEPQQSTQIGRWQNRHVFGLQYLMTRRLSAEVASLNGVTKRHAGPDDLQLISSRLLRSVRERAVHAALHCAPHYSE